MKMAPLHAMINFRYRHNAVHRFCCNQHPIRLAALLGIYRMYESPLFLCVSDVHMFFTLYIIFCFYTYSVQLTLPGLLLMAHRVRCRSEACHISSPNTALQDSSRSPTCTAQPHGHRHLLSMPLIGGLIGYKLMQSWMHQRIEAPQDK